MFGLVEVRIVDGRELARVGTRWLRNICQELVPVVWQRLHESLPLETEPEWDEPHGRPGGVWASASVVGRPWGGVIAERVYSEEAWAWLAAKLVGQPIDTTVTLHQLDEDGLLDDMDDADRGVGQLSVSVRCDEDDPARVRLSFSSSLTGPGTDLRDVDVSQRWADTVHVLAADLDLSYGHLCHDDAHDTSLESALRGPHRVRYVRSQGQVLRGYAWVTFCPPVLTRRLGGVDTLTAFGAFTQVRPLDHGGVFLQATACAADYDEVAVRRVFLALAPVLPTGSPKPDPMEEHPQRLVWEDPVTRTPAACYARRPAGRTAHSPRPVSVRGRPTRRGRRLADTTCPCDNLATWVPVP